MEYLYLYNLVDLIKDSVKPSDDLNEKYIGLEHIAQGTLKLLGHGTTKDIKSQKYRFKKGDILVGKLRPYFRKVVIAPFDGVCSTDIWVLRAKEQYTAEQIFPIVSSEKFINYIMNSSSGTRMPRANWNVSKQFTISREVIFNEVDTSNTIAKITEKINKNEVLSDKLNEYVKTIFNKWFVDFNFPDKNGEQYKENGGEFYKIEGEGKSIPIGWNYKKIDDVVDNILDHRGKTPKKLGSEWSAEGITALSAKIVKNGKLINLDKANKVSRELYEKWMSEKLVEGDILMTSEAPLGEFYFILIDTEYCLSQRLFAIRAKTIEVLPSYLYLELSQPRGLKKILARQSGSTVFGIRQEELRKVKVLVPTLSVQKEFNKLVFPMMKKIRMCEKENENLIELRDLLIRKLIK